MRPFLVYPLALVFTGFANAATLNDRIERSFAKGELQGLHAVIVVHRGKTIAERYFAGPDESWGFSLGNRQFDAASLHDVRSVTKSITSLLYGIALSQGRVPDPESVLVDNFPQYPDLADDVGRRRIRVRHVLSMMMGTQWDEALPYTHPENDEVAMERAKDRYRYVLDRPLVAEPGEVWTYSGGATTLIGHLISEGTGQTLHAYAKEKLFGPLGIHNTVWLRGSDNANSAASGLRMTARHLATIGEMLVSEGKHHGRQIVPRDWIEESFTPRTEADGDRYGYFWWLAPEGNPPTWAAAYGNGGQQLSVYPGQQLVVVVLTGNYNKQQAWKLPDRIIEEIVLPEIR